MQEESREAKSKPRLKAYLALTALLIILAGMSFLLVSGGGTLDACNRLIFSGSRYSCISGLALSQENASLCGSSGPYSDSCYAQVAERTSNAGTCADVQNGTLMGSCISYVATAEGNYTLCTTAGEPYSSICKAGIAVSLGNATLCQPVVNATYHAICSSVIGIRLASFTNNAAYCVNVSSSEDKNLTNYIIANATAGQPSQSSYLLSSLSLLPNTAYTARDYCYITVASQTANPALCANVSAGEAADVCSSQASAGTGNYTANFTQALAACEQAGSYAQACEESVIISQAVNTNNSTLCAQLSGGQDATCYSLLASTYNDSSYCGSISNSSERSACIANS